MQIFVTGTAYETAVHLDRKRLSNQITEARIILNCLRGKNGWGKHPLAKMYIGCEEWIEYYIETLRYVFRGHLQLAMESSRKADNLTPSWFSDWFYNVHRSRLYTKNKSHYKQWSYLGESHSNWYRVNGIWREYKQK